MSHYQLLDENGQPLKDFDGTPAQMTKDEAERQRINIFTHFGKVLKLQYCD